MGYIYEKIFTMSNPFDFFDKIYYINPDVNLDRKLEIEKEFEKYNIKAERFPGITLTLEQSDIMTKNGCTMSANPEDFTYLAAVRGVTLSHLNTIFLAKYQKFKNVLIFEDDITFTDNILEELSKCIEDLKQRDWDMFILGCNPVEPFYQVTDNISMCGGQYMSHAYVVNHTFYDKILSLDFSYVWVFDQHTFGLLRNQVYNCYMSNKNLVIQKPGISGSVGSFVDYNIGVEHNYKTNFKKLKK